MSKTRLLISVSLFGLAALTLSACATAPGGGGASPAAAAVDPIANDSSTPYGLFLAGNAASNDGDGEKASSYFQRAQQREPAAVFLKDRAFNAALMAGDVDKAAGLAPGADEASPSDQNLGRLTVAVSALARGDGAVAQTALAQPLGPPHRAAAILLAPWVAASAGDWKSALTLPDPKGDRLVDELSRLNQALLLERSKHYDAADAGYRKMLADGDGAGLITSAYVKFLERRGRQADALGICDAALKGDPNNRAIKQIRDQVVSKIAPPPMLTFKQGAAQSLLAPAAIFLAEKQPQLGLNYLRLILKLDPNLDEAWLLVGDTKAAQGDPEAARAAYLSVQPSSPDYVDARGRLIQTYDQPGDAPKALALAQETVQAAPKDDEALALLADALRGVERYDESAKVMNTLVDHLGAQASWEAYYMRGIALDRSGHWPEAERDFRKALSLKPDESEVLNYLGYSWIDRGEKLEEAKTMVEKAVSAKPDSGAMVDSLGWAYYRLGDFSQAVEQLERAAELEPADPDINDHLGDAYWRVGRHIEARFQWERVLSLQPTDKMRADVDAKLKNGLNDDGRPAAAAPAIASR